MFFPLPAHDHLKNRSVPQVVASPDCRTIHRAAGAKDYASIRSTPVVGMTSKAIKHLFLPRSHFPGRWDQLKGRPAAYKPIAASAVISGEAAPTCAAEKRTSLVESWSTIGVCSIFAISKA